MESRGINNFIDFIEEPVLLDEFLPKFVDEIVFRIKCDRVEEHFKKLFKKMESLNKIILEIFMCPETYQALLPYLRKMNCFDPECVKEMLQAGIRGNIWGATVRMDGRMPLGQIKLVNEEKK